MRGLGSENGGAPNITLLWLWGVGLVIQWGYESPFSAGWIGHPTRQLRMLTMERHKYPCFPTTNKITLSFHRR